jgi:hypothetical protein
MAGRGWKLGHAIGDQETRVRGGGGEVQWLRGVLRSELDMNDPDAIGDLPYGNGSVCHGAFEPFWKYLQSVLHNYQVAQERSHGEFGYLPMAMSIGDLTQLVKEECRRCAEIPVPPDRQPVRTG